MPTADRNREYERRRDPIAAVLSQSAGTTHCQPGISRRTADQRQFALANCFGGEAKSFANIFALKIWIGLEDLVLSHSLTDHANHSCNRNSQISDARKPIHLVVVHGNPREGFHDSYKVILPQVVSVGCGHFEPTTTHAFCANPRRHDRRGWRFA